MVALSFEVRKEQKTEGEEKFSIFENQFYDIVPLHSCARELKIGTTQFLVPRNRNWKLLIEAFIRDEKLLIQGNLVRGFSWKRIEFRIEFRYAFWI